VTLVDIHKRYLEKADGDPARLSKLLLDGIHPNEQGQQLVADALLPVVLEKLPQSDE
jgi:lysophospholipase L1-like esterase